MNGLFHGIELKGSCRKGDTSATFTFKSIRLQDTNWKHLLLVGRVRDPTSWLSIEDVESHVWLGYCLLCCMHATPVASACHTRLCVPQPSTLMGMASWRSTARRHVKRADYIRALTTTGRSPLEPHDATVTPRCTRGWLSSAVCWTRLEHLTRAWWERRVLRAEEHV